MGKGRKRNYIKNSTIIKELSQTKEGREWRIKLHEGKLTEQEWESIPRKLKPVLKLAEMVKTKTGERMTKQKYGKLFEKEITIEELDKYLTTVKNNTAPGISGIRVDHIKALPRRHREGIAKLLSIPYMTGMGYTAWGEQIVNWIPKEEGNLDINKRRPLMYYEVMWKICIGIRVRKVLQIWLRNGLIDENNYAFLTGKSTMQPLMIKKMIMEHARHKNKTITMVDI